MNTGLSGKRGYPMTPHPHPQSLFPIDNVFQCLPQDSGYRMCGLQGGHSQWLDSVLAIKNPACPEAGLLNMDPGG